MSFDARYNGPCAAEDDCLGRGDIRKGQRIEKAGGGKYRHAGCGPQVAPGLIDPAYRTQGRPVGDDEPPMWEDKQQSRDNAEYAQGYAEGKRYVNDVKTYGRELADQWEMDAELARYNRGDY